VSSHFDILDTPLGGLRLVQRRPIADRRGYLERLFCAKEMNALISGRGIVQVNHTLTTKQGTVRGMHFQYPPHSEIKFVSCLRGEVFDVAVDIRRGSSSFLRWHAEILSAENHATLVIPEGFAHGFQALTDDCEMLYLHTASYQADAEAGLNPLDPKLAIGWPRPIAEVSPRDAAHRYVNDHFVGCAV
jgi:dTDP-4-dehydrorhamnose 3,5-epimerase